MRISVSTSTRHRDKGTKIQKNDTDNWREFVYRENAFNIVPKLTKRTPKRTILRQDGAQDRQEEPQGEHFGAKMVSKIFGQAF